MIRTYPLKQQVLSITSFQAVLDMHFLTILRRVLVYFDR